jgi:hypothetical protein
MNIVDAILYIERIHLLAVTYTNRSANRNDGMLLTGSVTFSQKQFVNN